MEKECEDNISIRREESMNELNEEIEEKLEKNERKLAKIAKKAEKAANKKAEEIVAEAQKEAEKILKSTDEELARREGERREEYCENSLRLSFYIFIISINKLNIFCEIVYAPIPYTTIYSFFFATF